MPDRPTGEVSPRELLDAARSLEKVVVPALQEDIQTLKKANRRNRQGLFALTAGGFILLFVVIGLVLVIVGVDRAADKANAAVAKASTVQQYQTDACKAGNESRAAQRELWARIFTITGDDDDDDTPAERQAVADLKKYINKVFADRDCSRVLTGGQPTPAASPR